MRRLVAAECAAEAPAAAEDPEELQQAVWLRWLESGRQAAPAGLGTRAGVGGHADALPSARWLRGAVRAEARRARRRVRREIPLPDGVLADTPGADITVLAAEQRHLLAEAVARLPGPCPEVMRALFSGRDLTYPEIAGELGMSQGSLGPVRSRCLGCLRTMLAASDCGT
ncbi:sigma-70 family RNA polymerase sigma factor [Streptomyces bathyalis]|uniref:Sigma-70 family RNA polymerase sigma factor n=1 Tax=Streptomyces bathyalis TaxID=2710756 RepID=A0A7T1TDQ1_9ACTN|nr:sigma-70 family RNA polymerase sigma factor [Streptomyces bathyalis]